MAFGANFAVWIMDMLVIVIDVRWISGALDFLSLYSRNEPFLMGQLSITSVIYDISFTAVFLVLAVHRLDMRRCRGA